MPGRTFLRLWENRGGGISLIKLVSLYSGGGLMDYGFIQEGFEVVWACEIVPDYAKAYNNNIKGPGGQDVIVVGDITAFKGSDLPECDGIIGGPPCQDFSVAGKQKGINGEKGKLIWDYVLKIKEARPKFFVFENVEGLVTIYREVFNALVESLKSLGYHVQYNILNPLYFGIPQDRPRIFVVAFRNDVVERLRSYNLPTFKWPQEKYPRNIKQIIPWPKVGNISPAHVAQIPRELTVWSVIGDIESLKSQRNHVGFKPRSPKFGMILEGDCSGKSFKRLHRYRYSPAAAYGNNEVHLHPLEPRRLTVREALRIQSVPDSYHFPDDLSLTAMFKVVGNGVPTALAQMIARNIKQVMENYNAIKACTVA